MSTRIQGPVSGWGSLSPWAFIRTDSCKAASKRALACYRQLTLNFRLDRYTGVIRKSEEPPARSADTHKGLDLALFGGRS
jgi:hypothetical protein